MTGEISTNQRLCLIRMAKNLYELQELGKRLAQVEYIADPDKQTLREAWALRRAQISAMALPSRFHTGTHYAKEEKTTMINYPQQGCITQFQVVPQVGAAGYTLHLAYALDRQGRLWRSDVTSDAVDPVWHQIAGPEPLNAHVAHRVIRVRASSKWTDGFPSESIEDLARAFLAGRLAHHDNCGKL